MKYFTVINRQQYEVEILPDGKLLVNGKLHEVDFLALTGSLYSIIRDDKSLEVIIEDRGSENYEILLDGRLYEGQVLDERAMLLVNRKGGLKLDTGDMQSPMPGLIVLVSVQVGDEVQEGQTLVILESMKMQNELRAPRSGVVKEILINSGQTVEKGALLLTVGEA
jgi:biotin carboxyl carrier protein